MRCTFVPPYLLQRVALWAGTRHASDSGRETLQVDDRLRARRESPADRDGRSTPAWHPRSGWYTLPTTPSRCPARLSGATAIPRSVIRRLTRRSTHPVRFGICSTASSVGSRLTERGGTVSITVHYGRDYDNAFWDGTQLVFGDGDGQIFDRFTKPMDVMAHEYTHGVTQFTVGLAYQDQPGALNESISDVFASMAKQRVLGQTAAEADWLIGAGLFHARDQRQSAPINARAGNGVRRPPNWQGFAGRLHGGLCRDRHRQRRCPYQLRNSQPCLHPGRAGHWWAQLGEGWPGLVRHAGQWSAECAGRL